jgi:phosphoribosyl 1,2-cyclic phosphodiesterase
VQIRILGCRGSTPATGSAFERYGGDTSSVSVAHDGEASSLVLDAGTGLRRLAHELGDRPFRGAILLTHLHWDHTHGLPFARSVDRDDAEVDLFLPAQGVDPLELLSRGIGPPHFPITPAGLRGTWRFHVLEEGRHQIAGFDVLAGEIPHKGGRTFGYRIESGGRSMAYLPDHAQPDTGGDPVGLVEGADLLLHDSQHTSEEWPHMAFLGHSTVDYTVDLATRLDVGRLWLFHHSPSRTDDEIDAIVSTMRKRSGRVVAAAAGMEAAV